MRPQRDDLLRCNGMNWQLLSDSDPYCKKQITRSSRATSRTSETLPTPSG